MFFEFRNWINDNSRSYAIRNNFIEHGHLEMGCYMIEAVNRMSRRVSESRHQYQTLLCDLRDSECIHADNICMRMSLSEMMMMMSEEKHMTRPASFIVHMLIILTYLHTTFLTLTYTCN